MSEHTDLIDRYIAMWNETDGAKRRALIDGIWVEGARYLDPMLEGEGRQGIDAMVAGVHAKFPGHKFARTSAVNAHHDRVAFGWALAPEGGAPVVTGTDYGVLAGDKLQAITGFFDPPPAK